MDKPILKDSMHLFETLGSITSRSMFGGFGIFANGVMFALVVQNRLHIRADKLTLDDFKSRGYKPYSYAKRGFPVVTKYYALDDNCWNNPEDVFTLGKNAFDFAISEKQTQLTKKPQRIKDLPNLRLTTERMLKKAGINSVEDLITEGALNAYKAIKESHASSSISLELLWSLEGAIEGKHWSVIPQSRRDELLNKL
ncbi:TfoX/Sxy family DNA transformation protein [Vibrio sp. RC27]